MIAANFVAICQEPNYTIMCKFFVQILETAKLKKASSFLIVLSIEPQNL